MSPGTEPQDRPLRPTSMSRALRSPVRPVRPVRPVTAVTAGVLLGAVVLTGCGSRTSGGSTSGTASSPSAPSTSADPSTSGSPSASPTGCASGQGTPGAGPAATGLDLDGDGTREDVTLLTSPCGVDLVSLSGSRSWSVALAADEPPVQQVYGVRVPGRRAELVVTRASHPRGGFQLRVYAAQGSRLVELRRGSETLLPFVATDVQEHPYSVTCGRDALVVTEAVAHEPAGVIAAWDVRRTTNALGSGADVTAGPTREVADNVLPAALRRDWRGLVRHDAFAGCRVG